MERRKESRPIREERKILESYRKNSLELGGEKVYKYFWMKSWRLSRFIGDTCLRPHARVCVLARFRNEIAAATIICPAMHERLSVRIHRVTIVSDEFKLRSDCLHCAGRWLSFEPRFQRRRNQCGAPHFVASQCETNGNRRSTQSNTSFRRR